MYPSGSAPALIYGTPKIQKFSSSNTFPKLFPIVSSIGTFNYDLARFLCDLLSPVVPDYFSYKDPIPDDLKSFLVYKFSCVSCSSIYIGETRRHFKTRIEEHIKKDNAFHNFKHFHSTTACFDSDNSLSFKIIDKL